MKKVFNSLFVIIAAMITFAGCAKQETDAPATSETKTVQFFANSIETKTVFGTPDGTTYPTLWTAGDKVKVHVNLSAPSGVTKTETSVDVKLVGGEDMASSATFTAELNDAFEAESYTLYSVSPSSAWNARSANEGRFTVNIKSEQTPLLTSVDSDVQVLYAISGPYTDGIPTSVNLDYKHFTAYGKLSLKGLADGVVISKIKLESADLDLAGKWNYYVADKTVAAKEGVKYITLETSSTTDIWFACAPVDVSNKTLTLTVTTNQGDFVKELSFPANRKFEAGKISKFTVDMTGITAGGTDEPEQPGENEGTSVATLSSEEIKTKIAASKCSYGTPVSYEDMDDGVVWTSTCLTDADARPWLQMKAHADVYIKISSDSDIKEVEITVTGANNSSGGILDITKHSSFSGTLSLNTQADGKGTNVSSGSATNNIVTLTPTGNYKTLYLKTSAGARVWNIDVKKSDGGNEGGSETPEEPKTLVSIAVADDVKTGYTVGDEFVKPVVTATYDDESTADVTASATFTGYDMDAVGTHTVTVSYTEGEVTQTATYSITVNEAPAGPIVATVAQFLAAEESETVWYELTGTVSNISNTQYGNFNLVDATGTVYVYGLTATKVTSNDKSFASIGLNEGDVVTLIGTRAVHNNNPEVGGPAYYVSHVAAPTLEVSPANITVEADVTTAVFELSCDTGYDITYPAGVVEVSEEHSNETGSSTYTVSFPVNETADPIIYVITVKADAEGFDVEKTVTITQKAASQGGGDLVKGDTYSYEISNKTSVANSWNKLLGGTTNSAINISGFSDKIVEMGELTWGISASGANQIYFSGQQIGSSSNYITSFELETDSYQGAVESITLSTCSNAGNTTIEVYVGDKQLGSTITLSNTSSVSDIVFTGTGLLAGKIYIKYTVPTAKKNIKISNIKIN